MTNEQWSVPTPEAVERIKRRALAKVAAERRRRGARAVLGAVAVVALLALVAGAAPVLGRGRSVAGSEHALVYVPGFGMRPLAQVKLAASEPVWLQRGDSDWVEVRGLMVDDSGITLQLHRDGFSLQPTDVQVLDVNGQPLAARGGVTTVGGSIVSEATLGFASPVDPNTSALTVVVKDRDEWRLTVPLVPGKNLTTLERFGPTVTAQGYKIAGRMRAHSTTTELSLVVHRTEQTEAQFESVGGWSLRGGAWSMAHPFWSGTYATEQWNMNVAVPMSLQQVTVTIDTLTEVDPGQAIVHIPVQTGDLHQTVQIGRWPVRLLRTELVNGKFRLYLDLGPAQGARRLHQVRIGGPFNGWRTEVNPATNQDRLFEFDAPRGAKTIDLTLSHPTVEITGPWVIQVPVERGAQ